MSIPARPALAACENTQPASMLLLSPVKGLTKAELFKSPAKSLREPEPLLDENPDRFCMFPIKYQAVWEMYKKAEASFWTGEACCSIRRLTADQQG